MSISSTTATMTIAPSVASGSRSNSPVSNSSVTTVNTDWFDRALPAGRRTGRQRASGRISRRFTASTHTIGT